MQLRAQTVSATVTLRHGRSVRLTFGSGFASRPHLGSDP
jgi:hypothetical protein